MNPTEYEKLFDESMDVLELLEDTVSDHCDEKKLSGQKVWSMVAAIAHLKCQEFDTPDSTFTISMP